MGWRESIAKVIAGKVGKLPMDEASRMARAAEQGFNVDAYHGTYRPEFGAFKRKQNDLGSHFGTAEQASDRVSYLGDKPVGTGDPRIMPVKLNINNPLRLDDLGAWRADNLRWGLLDKKGFSEEAINDALRSAGNESGRIVALRNLIERRGYDGVVYKNTGEVAGNEPLRLVEQQARDAAYAALNKNPKRAAGFSVEEQQHPAYQAWHQAMEASKAHREANAADSYIAFRPNQVRSRFAAFDPAEAGSSDLLAGVAGAAVALPTLGAFTRQDSYEEAR